ncbi:MAG: hypothetical protein ACLPX9_22595 [Rhodomicrobium sp.]
MYKQTKAIAIFAAMIALPIVADNLLSRRPDIRLFGGSGWPWALVPAVILCAAVIPVVFSAYWKFKEDIEQIESWLKIAERELLKLLNDNWDQTGRHAKVEEREKWNRMAQMPSMVQTPSMPPMPPIPGMPPMVQTQTITETFNAGYRSVAHEAFDLNKDDMKGRGTAMGKAGWTAILLRELYQASQGRARAKVTAELESGGTPFVAPGIRELIAFKDGKLEEKAPFDWIKLMLAVRHGPFPKELILIDKKPDETKIMKGWEVIMQLTQQRLPDWQKPEPPKPSAPMWRLWLEWMLTFE